MSKTGITLVVPCDRCLDLANAIAQRTVTDEELIAFKDSEYPDQLKHLEKHLRTFNKGFFQICVSEEDFVFWPGGPDIRDYQLGGGKSKITLVKLTGPEAGVYSNDPADLPKTTS